MNVEVCNVAHGTTREPRYNHAGTSREPRGNLAGTSRAPRGTNRNITEPRETYHSQWT